MNCGGMASSWFDPLLRGAVLSEAQINPPSRIVPDEDDTVLAKVNGQAVWVRKCSRSSLNEVASASGKIARSNYDVRQDGTTLRIRPFSRAIDVPIPAGIVRLVVELGGTCNMLPSTLVRMEGAIMPTAAGTEGEETAPIPVSSDTVARFSLCDPSAAEGKAIAEPPFRIRPIIRRALIETRERIYPLFHRRCESRCL